MLRSLPLDILLQILRDLDTIDVIRLGLVSSRLSCICVLDPITISALAVVSGFLRVHTILPRLEGSSGKPHSKYTCTQTFDSGTHHTLVERFESLRDPSGKIACPLGAVGR